MTLTLSWGGGKGKNEMLLDVGGRSDCSGRPVFIFNY